VICRREGGESQEPILSTKKKSNDKGREEEKPKRRSESMLGSGTGGVTI